MTNKKFNIDDSVTLASRLILEDELCPRNIENVCALPSFVEKIRGFEDALGCRYAESPIEVRKPFIFRRLQQLTAITLLNPAWKDYLSSKGISQIPQTWEEWQQIPLCDKDTMTEFFTKERKGMVVPLDHGGFEIVASGGTSSGRPSETVYSLCELDDTYRIAGDFIGNYMLNRYLGNNRPKWLFTTLADYQMWSSGTMVGGVLQRVPKVNYIGAGPLSNAVYQHILSYHGDKAIMGISQSIASLVEKGEGLSEGDRKSLKVAMYGSGVLSAKQRKELRQVYPEVSILSYFAATQAEAIGLQLEASSQCLSSVPGLHFIEIVDADGRWVNEGEEGEIVITRLHATEAPVLRFKLGDRMIRRGPLKTENLETTCFEFAGRSGEVIQLRDTQYPVRTVYNSVCREFVTQGLPNPDETAYEYQFVNNRKNGILQLFFEVEEPASVNRAVVDKCGPNGACTLFKLGMSKSLSVFNDMEANLAYLQKSKYTFELRFVSKNSVEVKRSSVGKVPHLRDIII